VVVRLDRCRLRAHRALVDVRDGRHTRGAHVARRGPIGVACAVRPRIRP
jgi:hypothetical protein